MAITLEDLEKKFGDDAKAVYRKIAMAGGFGIGVSYPDLADNGCSEKAKKEIKEILAKAEKGSK